MKRSTLCAIIFFCTHISTLAPKNTTLKTKPTLMMHVFIHGTIFPIPSLPALTTMLTSNMPNSYQSYLETVRTNSLFHEQVIGPIGLTPIELNDPKSAHGPATHQIVAAYDRLSFPTSQQQEQVNRYYSFGWSGNLDAATRTDAAHKLHAALLEEKSRLEQLKRYKNITISIIAHSHGGTVAANLSTVDARKKLDVEDLILFGTPTGHDTKNILTSHIFKNIFHFFSTQDILQTMDIYSTTGMSLDRRLIEPKSTTKIVPNLYQIELTVGKLSPHHSELWMSSNLPPILYRPSFPLSPYPICAFTALMIRAIQKNNILERDLIINLNRTQEGLTCIIKKASHGNHVVHITDAIGEGIEDLFR
jgi:hypothetical protein